MPLTPLLVSLRNVPPRDWWLSLEANVEDVATFELAVELLPAPPAASPPCSDRFCIDPADPTRRWRTGVRDADDPGNTFTTIGTVLYSQATAGLSAAQQAAAAAQAAASPASRLDRGGAVGVWWRGGATLLAVALVAGWHTACAAICREFACTGGSRTHQRERWRT